MILQITPEVLQQIQTHGEKAYPEEGAGFLLGKVIDEQTRLVTAIYTVENAREQDARHNRYLITPEEMLKGENAAEEQGLDVIGVFHSHPDHPNLPSDFDREWAMPWYSYVITSIQNGKAAGSRSWRLSNDRSRFTEEDITELGSIMNPQTNTRGHHKSTDNNQDH